MTDPYAGYTMPGGNYIRFDAGDGSIPVGQTVTMRIGSISAARKFEPTDEDAPQLNGTLTDGTEASLACRQANLLAQVLTLKPQVGETISVTQTGYDGQRKLFNLVVHGREGAQPQAPAPASPPAAVPAAASPQPPAAPPAPPVAPPTAPPVY